MKLRKILIIRFSSIGDIVLTTPVLRCVKQQLDNIELHFCTKKQFAAIVAENPYIDQLHLLDEKGLFDVVKRLKAENFDVIIDLHNNLRTCFIKWKLGSVAYTFEKANKEKWLLVNFKKWYKKPVSHIVSRYLATVRDLGVKDDGKGLDYFIPEKDSVHIETVLPITHHSGYVAVVIGAAHATKQLPYTQLVRLCEQIKEPIVLLGGKEDADLANQILQHFAHQERIYNACGYFNLHQSASLVKQAKVVFTHDTGLMHIAAAFQKKIYSIWGNTIPAFGFTPYKTDFVVIENKHLDCRPCSKLGFNQCPQKHFNCMNQLNFEPYTRQIT
jgi:ADP-heptose:LPS heptosyltransferase